MSHTTVGFPDEPYRRLLGLLQGVRESGNGASARCPAHEDSHASLSISRGDNGGVVIYCHAGCETAAVLAKVGWTMRDVMPPASSSAEVAGGKRSRSSGRTDPGYATPDEAVNAAKAAIARVRGDVKSWHRWDYHLFNGEHVFSIVRGDYEGEPKDKGIRPVSIGKNGRWRIAGMPGPRPLYALPSLQRAPVGSTVFVVEGEKCATAVALLDLLVTTSAGGAQAADQTDWSHLRGHHVIILPDNNSAGADYARDVARLAQAAGAASVAILQLDGLGDGEDVADWIDRHPHRADMAAVRDDLAKRAAAASEHAPGNDAADDVRSDATDAPAPTPFPLDVLPPVLRRFVAEGATAHNIDAAFFGAPMLAVMAGAIGSTRRVEVRNGWIEPSVLWLGTIAASGTGKSPAQDEVVAPVREVDEELVRKSAVAHERYKAELAQWNRRQRRKDAEDSGAPPEPPPTLCALVDDITAEALAVRLLANPRGVTLALDELSSWFSSFDAYRGGRGGDEARWLGLYGGRPLKVDRKSGGTIYVPSPHVSVTGGIPPRVAARVLGQQRRESGLAARILFCAPPTRPSLWRDQGISSDARKNYGSVVQSLLDLQRYDEPLVLPLTAEARELFREAHDRLATAGATVAANGDEDMAAVYAKLRSAIPRMALVLALARAAETGVAELLRSVDHEAMTSAIALGEYFEGQAEALYARWHADKGSPLVAKVLAAIRAAGEQGATRTQIRDALGRNATAAQIDGALAALEEQRLILPGEKAAGGIGRPAERWRAA